MALTNRDIKHLKSLHRKKYRMAEKCFIVDGVRLLEESLRAGYLPKLVLYAPSVLSARGMQLVDGFRNRQVRTKSLSKAESERLAGTKSSPGITAVFDFRDCSLKQQLAAGPRKILVCDGIKDPGNLGTLLRSAAAFEYGLVIITGQSAEVTNPKAIRAGMGAYFSIPVVTGVDDEMAGKELTDAGYTLYCADIEGDDMERLLPVPPRTVLVIGSETSGPGSILRERSDHRVRIPMSEKTESLNTAVAGSILMYWIDSTTGARS